VAVWPEKTLVLGAAGPVTTHRRLELLLGDPARLARLCDAGVRLVVAGKAHPADGPGKALVAELAAAARAHRGRVLYLENLDMDLSRLMTRGCDAWLSLPRAPEDAPGSAGMKALMNGVVHVGVADGWWAEVCDPGENGFGVEPAWDGAPAERDAVERARAFDVLEHALLPAWRDPAAWTRLCEASVALARWRLSSDRVLEDLYDKIYRAPGAASLEAPSRRAG
jgi:starch phosphorylase